MTTLHLIRHGQTDWNLERRIQGRTDSYLTELGKQQAQDIAASLRVVPFSAAYSSSSIRAHDTAKTILQHHSLSNPLQLRDDMREIHLGSWEGQLYADVSISDPDNMHKFRELPEHFAMRGAETFTQIQNRAIAVVDELLRLHPQQHILLVSHGIWIKSVLNHFEGRAVKDFWLPPQMGNCSHSIINFDKGQARIVQYAGHETW